MAREGRTKSGQRSNASSQYGVLKRALFSKSNRHFNEEVFVNITTTEDIL